MAINNILQLMWNQQWFSQVCRNVFHYRVSTLTGVVEYEEVASRFRAAVTSTYIPLAATNHKTTGQRIDNLTNGLDMFVTEYTELGTAAGEAAPPFTAWSAKLIRQTKLTRDGYKRLAGIVESSMQDGVLTSAAVTAYTTWLGNVSPLNVTGAAGTAVLTLGILGRNDDGTFDLGRFQIPSSIIVVPRITSQVSRKIGRGE